MQLVDAARASGADAVKFQTFRADRLATAAAHKAAYQERTTASAESQFEMLRRLELSAEAHKILIQHCQQAGIQFLSSPFDLPSVDFLHSLDVPCLKVPSGEITNHPLLIQVARTGPVILSTGMCTLGDVEEALSVLQTAGVAEVTLLHCVTEYPAPFAEVNLRAMHTLRIPPSAWPVGYSDHTPGTEIAIAAVSLGAAVIEKHFTLDRALPGPDHAASLEPAELGQMVAAIRHVEAALGSGIKVPAPCELPNPSVARESVVAARSPPAGHRLDTW